MSETSIRLSIIIALLLCVIGLWPLGVLLFVLTAVFMLLRDNASLFKNKSE